MLNSPCVAFEGDCLRRIWFSPGVNYAQIWLNCSQAQFKILMHNDLHLSVLSLTATLLLSAIAPIAPARSELSSLALAPANSSWLAQADADSAPADSSPAENWQEFTSQQGQFSVSMPGEPTEEIEPASDRNGNTESGSFLLELQGDTLGYGVFYKNLPNAPNSSDAAQLKEFFDGFRDDFVQNGVLEGNLIQERDISLENYLGRELEVTGSEGFIKMRVYLVEKRLYLLLAASQTKEAFPQDGDRFFNSFKLLANRPTKTGE